MTPLYIGDLVRAFDFAIERGYSGTMNLAGNEKVNMRELAQKIGKAVECEPFFEDSGEESSDRIGDNTLMKQTFGMKDLTGLEEGLRETFSMRVENQSSSLGGVAL